MKKLNLNLELVFLFVCEILIGIVLLINPIGFANLSIQIFGIALIISGIFSGIGYIRSDPRRAMHGLKLFKALAFIILGIICFTGPNWFLATFPILTVLYGIFILLVGLFRVQWAADMFRLKMERWWIAAISAVLSILLGCVIILNPFFATAVLWTITALTLIVFGAVDLVFLLISGFGKEGEKIV